MRNDLQQNACAVLDLLAHHNLWVLAVSGGSDSMAMLHIVYEWVSKRASYPKVFVATIDHNTGVMAKYACNFVKYWTNQFGFEFITSQFQHDYNSNFYSSARSFRYSFLKDYIHQREDDGVIMTAHHLQDSIETVMMNIERGSGVDGLRGILPITKTDYIGIMVARPLIACSKDQINNYLSNLHFPWIEDRANADTNNRRAFYRHKILPVLGPVFAKRLALMSDNMRMVHEALQYYVQQEQLKCILTNNDRIAIDMEYFSTLPLEIQRRVLVRTISKLLDKKLQPRLKYLDTTIKRIVGGVDTVFYGVRLQHMRYNNLLVILI